MDGVGLSGVAGVLPVTHYDLADLAAAGWLASSPETLAGLGFERAHICGGRAVDMALDAARAALEDAAVEPQDVGALIWASARAECHLYGTGGSPSVVMDGFRYASAWLQNALGLENADVLATAQQGCATMFSALRLARSLLTAEPQLTHVLCVAMDALPAGAPREIFYNVVSDGACAVVVSRGCGRDRWLGFGQISRGCFWDPAASVPETMAAYFPTAHAVIARLLADVHLAPSDVDVVVATGMSPASWEILLRLVGIPEERLFRDGLSFGHTMTSDTFLYLQELRRAGTLPAGSRLLLFTFGFGSHWSALVLEH